MRCNARNCTAEATWLVRYEADLHTRRRPTEFLCEHHAKRRRDTRHNYIVERRPRT